MTRWFGFTQDGEVIALGQHEDIDSVDNNTEEGQHCTWLWDEKSMIEFRDQINEALK